MSQAIIFKSLFDDKAEEQLQWLLQKALPRDAEEKSVHYEAVKTDIKSFALKFCIDFIQVALQTRIELYGHSQNYDVQQVFKVTNQVAKDTMDILYKYFWDKSNEKRTKEIQIKVMKALLKRSSKQTIENREGFDEANSESENEKEDSKFDQYRKKKLDILYMDIKEEDDEISEKVSKEILILKDKIKHLETLLAEMTSAYFRDMKSLQDNLFQGKEDDFILVDYFDQIEKLDENQKVVVRTLLESIRVSYRSSLNSIHRKLQQVERNAEHFKKQLQILMNMNDPSSLLKALLFLEKNPYKIWKEIQDIVGNKFFFQVFQFQQHNYGINYREIDQLLFYSGAANRQFQIVKDNMDDQLAVLAKQTKDQLEQLQQQQVNLQNEIYINKQEKSLKAKIEEKYLDITKLETTKTLNEVLNIYEKQQRAWFKDWQKVDFLKLIISAQTRAAISRWSLFTKFIRFSTAITKLLKNLDISQKQLGVIHDSIKPINSKDMLQVDEQLILMRKMLINECKQKKPQDNSFLQQLDFYINEIYLQLNQVKLQYQIEKDQNDILNDKNIQLENELEGTKTFIAHLRQEKLKLEQISLRYEKAYCFLISKLNFRKNEIPLEAYSEAGQTIYQKHIVSLINRIAKLTMGDRIIIEEYAEFQDKCEFILRGLENKDLNNLSMKFFKDTFTQTTAEKIQQNQSLNVEVLHDNTSNTPSSKLSKKIEKKSKFTKKMLIHIGIQVDLEQKQKQADIYEDGQQFSKITPLNSEQTQFSQLQEIQKHIKSDQQSKAPLILDKNQIHTVSFNQKSSENNSITFKQLDKAKKVSFLKDNDNFSPNPVENLDYNLRKKSSQEIVQNQEQHQIIYKLGKSLEIQKSKDQEDYQEIKFPQQETKFRHISYENQEHNIDIKISSQEYQQTSLQNTTQIFFDPNKSKYTERGNVNKKYGKLIIGPTTSKISNILFDSNYFSTQNDQQDILLKLIKYEQNYENQIMKLSSRGRNRHEFFQNITKDSKIQKLSERKGKLPFVKDTNVSLEPKLLVTGQHTRRQHPSLSPPKNSNLQIKLP